MSMRKKRVKNGKGYREEDRQEDDRQEDNLGEGDPRGLRNGRLQHPGGREEDAGGQSRILAKLDRRCTHMEMKKKDKNKSLAVDRLLSGIDSPFTSRVANYRLPEKFKVPQIMSYVGDGDPLDHLENFQAHLDLHRTSNEVACWAFPLTLLGNARD